MKDSRAEVLDAAEGLSEGQANASPAPGRWSVVECVEHVIAVESLFLRSLRKPDAEAAPPASKEREAMILARVAGRAAAIQAPEPVRPSGRFTTLAEALTKFEAVRANSIRFVETQGDGLYLLAAKHPFLGVCNGAEAMVLIAAHSRRHAAQIREIRTVV